MTLPVAGTTAGASPGTLFVWICTDWDVATEALGVGQVACVAFTFTSVVTTHAVDAEFAHALIVA